MPARDEVLRESRRQQIIDAALEVFASKGFEKATNKDIAAAAGIRSAGLIYHYFKDKDDLLRQVLEERLPVLQLISRGEAAMDQPPREVLTRFATAFLSMLERPAAAAIVRLMLGESLRRPALAEIINRVGPGRGLAFLRSYLEHQMQRGVLRREDPSAAARCFVGPLVAFMLLRAVFPQPDSATLDAERMIATTVDIFLRGMQPLQGSAPCES